MKKKIKGLDINVYSYKLDNGLEVYISPDSSKNDIFVTYTTRFGSANSNFYYNNELVKVIPGIAHFLEHKMFEEEDGTPVFDYYSKYGNYCNAFTSRDRTCYLFKGKNNFYNSLEYLLSYLEKPYFTDTNVEKEKGIIIEELTMGEDSEYRKIIETVAYNAFINSNNKYPTIGTRDTVNSITKEDLYKCYNTFYNPNNMFLIITGNIDVDKTIEVIKKHEDKRKINKIDIKEEKYIEPDNVEKDYEEVYMDITYPKLAIAYKININNSKDKYMLEKNIINAVDLKLGLTSKLNEKLRKKKIINSTIHLHTLMDTNHILLIVMIETDKIDKARHYIEKELKSLSMEESSFNRRIKSSISAKYSYADSITSVNELISTQVLKYNKIDYDPINTLRKLDIKEINNELSKLDLSNKTICVIKGNK